MARKYKDEDERAREIALRVVQMIAELDKADTVKKAADQTAAAQASPITNPDATRIIEASRSDPQWIQRNRSTVDRWKQHQDSQFEARYGITGDKPAGVIGNFDPSRPTVVYFLGADIPSANGTMPVTLAADKIRDLIAANPAMARQNVVFVSTNGLDMTQARERAATTLAGLYGSREAAARAGVDAVFINHGSPGKDGEPGTYLASVGGPDGMKNRSITELRAFGVDDPDKMWRNIQLANCFGSDVFKALGMLRPDQNLHATPRGTETSALEFGDSIVRAFHRTGGSLAVNDVAPERFATTLKAIADVRADIEKAKAEARSRGVNLDDRYFAQNSDIQMVRLVASGNSAAILPRQVMVGDKTIDLVRDVMGTRPAVSAEVIRDIGGVFKGKEAQVQAIAARIAAGSFSYDGATLEDKAIALSLAQRHHMVERERQRQAATEVRQERAAAAAVVEGNPRVAAVATVAGAPAREEIAEVEGGRVVTPAERVVAEQRDQGTARSATA